jgi:hypothetical protein
VITINDVRDGVIGALSSLFPAAKIYGEEIKQGFTPRSFFVKVMNAGQDREVGQRYKRMHAFDVHYFADIHDQDLNEELHAVAEQLYGGLERVSVPGGTCRGTGMSHEIVDRTLHFFVQYNFHVIRQQAAGIKMQTLEQEGAIKNGG